METIDIDFLKKSDQATLMDTFAKEVNKKWEEVLIKVIEMVLKRPYVLEDAKHLTIVYHPDLNRPDHYLQFDNVIIGKVCFDFSQPAKVTVTFKPSV